MNFCVHSLPPPDPGCHYIFEEKGDYVYVFEVFDKPFKKQKNEKVNNISPPKKKSKNTCETVAMETEENEQKVRPTTTKKSVQS